MGQRVGNAEAVVVADDDIENGQMRWMGADNFQGVAGRAADVDAAGAHIEQDALDDNGNQRLVLENEDVAQLLAEAFRLRCSNRPLSALSEHRR